MHKIALLYNNEHNECNKNAKSLPLSITALAHNSHKLQSGHYHYIPAECFKSLVSIYSIVSESHCNISCCITIILSLHFTMFSLFLAVSGK